MKRHDVVVVGAGIVGLAVAHRLSEEGAARRILVVDPKGIGQEVTAVAPGGVRQQWSTAINCRMARYAHAFFRDAARRLAEPQIHLAEGGYLFLAHEPSVWRSFLDGVAVQHEEGIATEVLGPADLYDRFAFLAPDPALIGGTFLQEDGYLDRPQIVVNALERAARRAGVAFRFTAVTGLAVRAGRVEGVETSDGREAADLVVICAGIQTPSLLAPLGIACPIRREPKHLLFSRPIAERFLEPLVVAPHEGVATKQLASGHLMASDLDATDPEDILVWRRRIRAFCERALPQAAMVELTSATSGYYDSTPDHQAIVSGTGVGGLYVAAGMSGHGFMMAPAVARTVESLVTGTACPWPLAPLALDRFAGRSAPLPERHVV